MAAQKKGESIGGGSITPTDTIAIISKIWARTGRPAAS